MATPSMRETKGASRRRRRRRRRCGEVGANPRWVHATRHHAVAALGLMWARLRLTDGTTAPGLSGKRAPLCLGGSLAPPLVQLSAPPSEKATSSQGLVLLLLHGSPTLFESDRGHATARRVFAGCSAAIEGRSTYWEGPSFVSSHLTLVIRQRPHNACPSLYVSDRETETDTLSRRDDGVGALASTHKVIISTPDCAPLLTSETRLVDTKEPPPPRPPVAPRISWARLCPFASTRLSAVWSPFVGAHPGASRLSSGSPANPAGAPSHSTDCFGPGLALPVQDPAGVIGAFPQFLCVPNRQPCGPTSN